MLRAAREVRYAANLIFPLRSLACSLPASQLPVGFHSESRERGSPRWNEEGGGYEAMERERESERERGRELESTIEGVRERERERERDISTVTLGLREREK